MMRAISLWNPWAAAIALGYKRAETRSWGTRTCGLLAIQSAKRWRPDQQEAARTLAAAAQQPADYFLSARRGVVLCVARLVACERMTAEMIAATPALEQAFGTWEPGRWAWRLEDILPLVEPYPLKGQQGIWTLPADVEQAILARTMKLDVALEGFRG